MSMLQCCPKHLFQQSNKSTNLLGIKQKVLKRVMDLLACWKGHFRWHCCIDIWNAIHFLPYVAYLERGNVPNIKEQIKEDVPNKDRTASTTIYNCKYGHKSFTRTGNRLILCCLLKNSCRK